MRALLLNTINLQHCRLSRQVLSLRRILHTANVTTNVMYTMTTVGLSISVTHGTLATPADRHEARLPLRA